MRWLILAFIHLWVVGCSESAVQGDVVFPIVTEPNQVQSTAQSCTAPVSLQNLSPTTEYTIVFAKITARNDQDQLYEKVYDSEQFTEIFGGTQLPPRNEIQTSIELTRTEADLGAGPLDVNLLLVGAQFHQVAYFSGQWICE